MSPTDTEPALLHQDDDLLVAYKPTQIATVPEHRNDPHCLQAQLQRLSGSRLWAVHRLDKEVSGLLVFARHAEEHRRLCALFERRKITKIYLGLVWGTPPTPSGSIDLPLREYGSGRVAPDPVHGKPSLTHWQTAQSYTHYTLLHLTPHTGRRHQLRAHTYALQHPLAGDPRYGDAAKQQRFPRLMLHAWQLTLPRDGLPPLSLTCPPPPLFQNTLRHLPEPA